MEIIIKNRDVLLSAADKEYIYNTKKHIYFKKVFFTINQLYKSIISKTDHKTFFNIFIF